jgi:signal transduction histidine kinase/ligand-binding sensor domain-containing protein/CheY-like chemotaxis protein
MKNIIGIFCLIITLLIPLNIAYGSPIGHWKSYTCAEGLSGGNIRSMLEDNEGNLWIATDGDGVSKYDGNRFQNFTKGNTNNGLASDFVMFIAKNNNGELWFATWGGGICRYNGKSFDKTLNSENSQLLSNLVQLIYIDSQSRLWIGTDKGVCLYDGKIVQRNINGIKGLPRKWITAIYEDKSGNMWFGTGDGFVYRYRNGFSLETQFIAPSIVTSILEDHGGNMWFGTWKGLFRSNGKVFPEQEKPFLKDKIEFIFEDKDKDGTLWFATVDGGAIMYDGKRIEAFNASENGLPWRWVTAILSDRESNLWYGTWGGGICKYDRRVQNYFLSDKEIKSTLEWKITSAIEDRSNNIWFVTNDAGIFRFDSKILANDEDPIHYTKKDELISDTVVKVVEDLDGSLWFGGIGGMTKYQGKTFKQIRNANFPSTDKIIPILVDGYGNLWIDIRKGEFTTAICKYHDGKVQIYRIGVPKGELNNFIEVSLADRSGKIWFGMGFTGLYRYNGTMMEHLDTKHTKGLDGNKIRAVVEDANGNVWIGISGNDTPRNDNKILAGLCKYNGKTFQPISSKDGLSTDSVTSALLDKDNNLWFGMWHGGASRYDGKTFTNFTTYGDNLAGNTINFILREEMRERLWFGTQSAGISQYYDGIFQNLTTDDGLIKNWVKPILADSQGNVWLVYEEAGSGIITRYTPSKTHPIVRVTQVNSKEISAGRNNVDIDPNVRKIVFGFSALSKSDKLRYLYQLKEYDDSWRITENRQAEYEGLKPGKYTFLVKAVDQDLNHSEPASISITVIQPWYLAPIPIILLGIIILGFIVFSSLMLWKYIKLRRQLNEQNRRHIEDMERKNEELLEASKATEEANKAKTEFLTAMSHDIRTPIGVIIGYARLLMAKEDLQQDIRRYSEQIENSGNVLLTLINNIMDISRIENNRMELRNDNFDLISTLNELSNIYRFRCVEKNLTWQFEWYECEHDESNRTSGCKPENRISISHPPWIIINADKSKLVIALNNLLSNAVKFTESGNVNLRIIIHKAGQSDESGKNTQSSRIALTFEVEDTGIGISAEDQTKIFEKSQQGIAGKNKDGIGFGLYLAESHINSMGGKLELKSELNSGSLFFFTLSFEQFTDKDSQSQITPQKRVKHLMKGYNVNALVVDDSKEYRDILTLMLNNIGVQVTSFEDGEKALKSVRSHIPDIVFMDILMSPISGIETAHRVWTEFGKKATKIVAITASAFVHQLDQLLSEGFDAYIVKPFTEDKIYDCLANTLGIEYEYIELSADSVLQIDLSQISLPANLLLGLKEAAEFYSVTDIRNYLDKLRELSEDGRKLADYLSIYLQSYDMKGILDILSKVGQE